MRIIIEDPDKVTPEDTTYSVSHQQFAELQEMIIEWVFKTLDITDEDKRRAGYPVKETYSPRKPICIPAAFADLAHEYTMGYDSAINGSNTINSHFSLFASPEQTKAWEAGRRIGGSE